ncbi:SGNH/GDSL hydrolase family protein [Dichotomicrobium thermohalophilum]|uniref:SGNH/GDSL hydrolase family protein n=1 Tax=Dichotomicrobium thermohalophilum TaxID=933063 RepID=UPI0014746618|nr:DUF459 domain-containing protein [Dichotomicrobium thermohalophilum]
MNWHWIGVRAAKLAVGLAALAFALTATAHAQDDDAPFVPAWTQSYINPFPETDKYKLYVIGDFLAAGLATALPEALDESASIEIEQETRNSSGLARPDRYNWSRRIEDILEDQTVHVAVIMLGTNDRRRIRAASGFEDFGTEAWAEAYRLRVDSIIEKLTKAKVAVYWMGLPIVADEEGRAEYEQINSIIRERAYIGGVKYIDTWNGFSDQFGNFSAYGPSVEGVTKRLRDNNGIGFTAEGNRKLAEFAASVIKRDLAAARRERSIPLAGDEQQQAQIARMSQEQRPDEQDNVDEATAETGDAVAPVPGDITVAEENAENGRGNRAVSFSDYSPPGEQLAIDIGDNLTALATISPANILSARGARQQLPLSERLYYRVLVQGEKLKAPEGRIDNYAWEGG